jgi:hypothetical protein
MAYNKYVINKGYDDEREVKALDIETKDGFVDFKDNLGLVLRLRQEVVQTVERDDEQQ